MKKDLAVKVNVNLNVGIEKAVFQQDFVDAPLPKKAPAYSNIQEISLEEKLFPINQAIELVGHKPLKINTSYIGYAVKRIMKNDLLAPTYRHPLSGFKSAINNGHRLNWCNAIADFGEYFGIELLKDDEVFLFDKKKTSEEVLVQHYWAGIKLYKAVDISEIRARVKASNLDAKSKKLLMGMIVDACEKFVIFSSVYH